MLGGIPSVDLSLGSGRHPPADPRLGEDAQLAAELAAGGHRVRWIVPFADPAATAAPPLVELIRVPSAVPGFRAVLGRLADPPSERAITTEVRRGVPDLVHLLAFGGDTSVNVSWAAARMGARTLVSLRAAPTLCHRGNLIHADATPCRVWSDAARCATCCAPVTRLGRGLAGLLRCLRSPIQPYPTASDFTSRVELLLGGLRPVDRICVESAEERQQVLALGLRSDQVEVLGEPTVGDWLDLYGRIIADRRNGKVPDQ
jgi:hypothetical protein